MSLINRLKQAMRVLAGSAVEPETDPPIDPNAAWAALESCWTLSHELFGIPRHWTLRQLSSGDDPGYCTPRPEYGYVYIGLNTDQIDSIDFLAEIIVHELCHAADAHWFGAINQLAATLEGAEARAADAILTHACELAVQQRLQSSPAQQLIAHARATYLAALQGAE
ncbi:hypothetical protein [Deinococcus sedimenti]|uniref:Metalloprotease n=1 Tax=Deinococcus sedimenti TaxID=1867090 RepID=A0ABQ2RZX9_9DEIO|nr:hypothetical protein [Deinococcus sedimenti]GGR84401.1 hypothetical protein GCM10008960_09300 [Deinococcus sedimenti]